MVGENFVVSLCAESVPLYKNATPLVVAFGLAPKCTLSRRPAAAAERSLGYPHSQGDVRHA